MQLARTWIYSWGWREGSGGRSATISSKERTILPAFQISKHSCVPGTTRLPRLPAWIIRAEMELLTLDCVCASEAKSVPGVVLLPNQLKQNVF